VVRGGGELTPSERRRERRQADGDAPGLRAKRAACRDPKPEADRATSSLSRERAAIEIRRARPRYRPRRIVSSRPRYTPRAIHAAVSGRATTRLPCRSDGVPCSRCYGILTVVESPAAEIVNTPTAVSAV
jgi:hypothetical protein